MAIEHYETSLWVPHPLELVFAFFANPANLAHLSPPELRLKTESVRLVPPGPRPQVAEAGRRFQSVAAGQGSEVEISFRPLPWLPLRMHWTARIVEFVWFSHFIDEQVRGPFVRFRHRHGMVAERRDGVEGTLTSDQIDYALRGGPLAGLMAARMRRQLDQQFAVRQQRLSSILEAAARQARGQR